MADGKKGGAAALLAAKKAKKDEFYTQYDDIQAELNHYTKHFEGKTVLCNCDDPYESNFCKFFLLNFKYLKLKRLICTSYAGSCVAGKQLSLFDEGNVEDYKIFNAKSEEKDLRPTHGYVMDVDHVPGVTQKDINAYLHSDACNIQKLQGNGDFRSDECVAYLKQADIVVTNPPFSQFRDYVAQLMEYDKKFLIIGNKNAITYKEIFPLLKENKVWLGYNSPGIFATPGNNLNKRVIGIPRWYTNLEINKRLEDLILYKHYTPKPPYDNIDDTPEIVEVPLEYADPKYPPYDNYNAIEVSKVAEIPDDYAGVMGVPITFLDKYNPEQFEILGYASGRKEFDPRSYPTKWYINPIQHNTDGTTASGSKVNTGAELIWRKTDTGVYYTADNSKYKLKRVYDRILIRNKHPKLPAYTLIFPPER